MSESYLTCASQVTDNSGPLPKAANPVAATPEYTAGLSIVTPKEFKTGKVILLIVLAPVNVLIDIGLEE